MVFHSTQFALFLVAVLVLFWALSPSRRSRTVLLLVASYVFYASWHPYFLLLIVFSTLLDHACGRGIAASQDPGRRRALLLLSLGGNLGLLGFFKYHDFFVESGQQLFATLGLEFPLEVLGLVVPVGISFYTFQTLSYTIDIYRGTLAPARSLLDFAVFVGFFPQLVAGPIVRAAEFLPQMELPPRFDRARLNDGLYRIATGLAKKVFIADVLGRSLVDPVYAAPEAYGAGVHLLAVYGFCFQIYGDFSGYSDIAIGAARLFGFDLPENFRTPFRSRSVREFWRRWHTTLSFWVRDYVYFPLGGSRVGSLRVAFNLVLTMVLIGLWHGASLLWIVYGLLNGVAMTLERLVTGGRGADIESRGLKALLGGLATFHFVAVTLILVRAQDLDLSWAMLTDFGEVDLVPAAAWWALAGGVLLHYLPDGLVAKTHALCLRMPALVAGATLGVLIGLLALVIVGDTPYIYFQF